MRWSRRLVAATLGLGLLCGVPVAQAASDTTGGETVAYKCTMNGAKRHDWIQPLIFIARNSSGRVVVSDAVILGSNDGQPIDARVVTDNARRITFAWDVQVTLRVSPITMSYRGTYVKSSGVFSVLASPRGYSNNFTKGGSCEVGRLKN